MVEKEVISKEEVIKMRDELKKESKEEIGKLTQEEQLKKDIAAYNSKIVELNNQIQRLAGAKTYAEEWLKKLEKKDGRDV